MPDRIFRRLRRWWALRCMQARLRQLACHIQELECAAEQTCGELGALRMERRTLQTRYDALRQGRRLSRPFITWS